MSFNLLSYIFPKKCIFCMRVLPAAAPICICGGCASQLPYYKGEYLFEDKRGGGGGNGGSGGGNGSGGSWRGASSNGSFVDVGSFGSLGSVGKNYCDRIICVLKYTGNVRKTISGLKFHGHREYGMTLAALLCDRLTNIEWAAGQFSSGEAGRVSEKHLKGKKNTYNKINEYVNLVTCVPLSHGRLRERGYNQAAILAKYTALYLNIPFEGGLLARDEQTLRQSSLKRSERRANVNNTFRVDIKKANKVNSRIHDGDARGLAQPGVGWDLAQPGGKLRMGQPGSVRGFIQQDDIQNELPLLGAHILLVDDIATSMSTINACAALLKAAGADEVVGAVLAAP